MNVGIFRPSAVAVAPACQQEVEFYLGLIIRERKARDSGETRPLRCCVSSQGVWTPSPLLCLPRLLLPRLTYLALSQLPVLIQKRHRDHGRILLREAHQTRAQGNQGQEVNREFVRENLPLFSDNPPLSSPCG